MSFSLRSLLVLITMFAVLFFASARLPVTITKMHSSMEINGGFDPQTGRERKGMFITGTWFEHESGFPFVSEVGVRVGAGLIACILGWLAVVAACSGTRKSTNLDDPSKSALETGNKPQTIGILKRHKRLSLSIVYGLLILAYALAYVHCGRRYEMHNPNGVCNFYFRRWESIVYFPAMKVDSLFRGKPICGSWPMSSDFSNL